MEEKNQVINLEEFNATDVVKLTRKAVIKESLKKYKKEIIEKTQYANTLIATEENKIDVKKTRSDLNRVLTELERERVNLKKEVLKPYDEFEEIYKHELKVVLENSIKNLDNQIKTIDSELLKNKTKGIIDYFNEYRTTNVLLAHIDFEKINLKITLSTTDASLKKRIKEILDKKAEELLYISNFEGEKESHELLWHYKTCDYDLSKSLLCYNVKKKEIENFSGNKIEEDGLIIEEELSNSNSEEIVKELEKTIDEFVEVTKEFVEEKEEKTYNASFTVNGTLKELKMLKEFLEANKINYKTIKGE